MPTKKPTSWLQPDPDQPRKQFTRPAAETPDAATPASARGEPAGALGAEMQEFFGHLCPHLKAIESHLVGAGFARFVVAEAKRIAKDAAIDAICSGKAERMTAAHRWRWLRVVARRAAVTFAQRNRLVPLPDDAQIPAAQENWMEAEDRRRLLEALRDLPADLRAVVDAIYFENLSGREAAKGLGIPETTLRRMRELAVALLGERMR